MIQIFVDSGANLSAELREQYNIHLLPMALTINDQPAPEGLDGHEYYEALRSGADVRTSMVNPDDAKKAFETYVSQGDDVVYFSISAGISGSWWSAKLAGDELMEEYPGRRVCPIDSMGASLGAGIPALKASSLVRQGMELDELVEKMTVYCQNYCQYFAVDDLKYLRKGGRISGASALVGSLLQIKPILRGNEEGKIVLFDKTRGKLRAIERLVSIYKERAIDLDDLIGISHGDCPGEALRLETKLREAGHRGPILLVPHEPVTGAMWAPACCRCISTLWENKKTNEKTAGPYTGAHKTVILKITTGASVMQGWQRNNGYPVSARYPLFFCRYEKQWIYSQLSAIMFLNQSYPIHSKIFSKKSQKSLKALEQFSPSHAIYSRGLNTKAIGGDADGQANRPERFSCDAAR